MQANLPECMQVVMVLLLISSNWQQSVPNLVDLNFMLIVPSSLLGRISKYWKLSLLLHPLKYNCA